MSLVEVQVTQIGAGQRVGVGGRGCQAPHLWAALDVLSLVEAQVTQIGAGRALAGLAVQGQIAEVVRKVRHAAERRRADGLRIRALKGVLQQHNHQGKSRVISVSNSVFSPILWLLLLVLLVLFVMLLPLL